MDAIEQDSGPVYGVRLIDSLPLGKGGMRQAMPTRRDLKQVQELSTRTVAGYEVLLDHYRNRGEEIDRLKGLIRDVIAGNWSPTVLQEAIGEI